MKRFPSSRVALTALLLVATGLPVMANELRIGLQDDPDVLDPDQSRTFAGRIVYTAVCDKLVDLSPDVEIIPQLATDWEYSDDATSLVLNLRDDVVFHDGTPFNAEAVIYNINRSLTLPESRRKSELASVDTVTATGPYQVTIALKSPDASLLAQFADRAGMMFSPAAAEEAGADLGNKLVCSGPFTFVERIQQDRIVVEKFADYWNADAIKIDRVVYLPIPDSTVRLANLQSGELDLASRLAPTDIPAIRADADLTEHVVTGLGYGALYMNVANGPRSETPIGQDKRVRQAFSKAIDRAALSQIIYEGTASPGNQAFPPNSPWYNKNFPVEERDVEGAKALLAEAGIDRLEVQLQHPNTPIMSQMMQVVQAMVAEAGFDVRLQALEFATQLAEQSAGNYEVSRTNWSGRADPDGSIHQFVTCEGGINDTGYCNEEVDNLLNAARTLGNPAKRKELYDQATAILIDELPVIYLVHESYITAHDAGVTGFVPYPDGMIRLENVTDAD
ncbi:family 5 extracellular solute-binding protein [Stappia sp. 22II-S9-Z10]|nr:family 5 extracellular solute-binding protein [Stappia sp. 22II-S9-Z10]